ncbi:MAG TPA: transcriptional regulator [Bacillota bacterium]|nr:transcriptional regulator [Bacillota bacterium]
MKFEQIYRIGDKLISFERIERLLARILKLRAQGFSQQEVARRLSLDRSFISRLESAGEIRKGKRVAVVGFPIDNTAELSQICRELGLDFYFILNNRERWELVREKQALDFFNQVLDIVTRLRSYDTLVLLTSEHWYSLAEALLDLQIVYINLGPTPVEEDRRVDPLQFRRVLMQVLDNGKEREEIETRCGD